MLRGTVGGLVVMNGEVCMVAEFYGQRLEGGESPPPVSGPGAGLVGMSVEVLGASLDDLVVEAEAKARAFLAESPLGRLILHLDEVARERGYSAMVPQVKAIREMSGLNLRESKDLLDAALRPMQSNSFSSPPVVSKDLMLRLLPSSGRVEALRTALAEAREAGRQEGAQEAKAEARRNLSRDLGRLQEQVEYFQRGDSEMQDRLDVAIREKWEERARVKSVLAMVLGGLRALDLGSMGLEEVGLGPIVRMLEAEAETGE